MSFGKNKSSNQSQSTTTQALDPQVKQALLGNYSNVQNLVANTPSQYNGQLVAPMNAAQNQGNQALTNLATSGVGNAALGQAGDTYNGLSNFQPSQVQAGQLANTDLTPYMTPYTKNVTDLTMLDLERQRQIENVANDQKATQAGAFGGDRSGVLDALTNEGFARTGAQTYAGLNQANYSNAQSSALQDIVNRLTAQQGNQNAATQGANVRLQAGQGLQSLSGQQVSQGTALANLLRQAGAQQQGQAQSQLDASRNQFQTNLGNTVTMQQLLNQALGLAGDPVLGRGQSTGSGSASGFSISRT